MRRLKRLVRPRLSRATTPRRSAFRFCPIWTITFIHCIHALHPLSFATSPWAAPAARAGLRTVKKSIDTRTHCKLHAPRNFLAPDCVSHTHLFYCTHMCLTCLQLQAAPKQHTHAVRRQQGCRFKFTCHHHHRHHHHHRYNHRRCSQRSHSPNCVQANSAPSHPGPSVGDSFNCTSQIFEG